MCPQGDYFLCTTAFYTDAFGCWSKHTKHRFQQKNMFAHGCTIKVPGSCRVLHPEMKDKDEPQAGDTSCDSPGHNAKFCSYTLMDNVPTSSQEGSYKKKIVSLHLVQVSQVKNSDHMEPQGLERCLDQLMNEDDLTPSVLATDRHLMVGAIMKIPPYNVINHQFDVWHLMTRYTNDYYEWRTEQPNANQNESRKWCQFSPCSSTSRLKSWI